VTALTRGALAYAKRVSRTAIVIAVAIPFIFLHPTYQPSVGVSSATVDLTDVAIVVVLLAVLSDGRACLARLRPGFSVWVPLVLFLAWLWLSMTWARHNDSSYGVSTHVISATKYVEYALLAPAVAVGIRTAEDRFALMVGVVAWSSFLTLIAALQFLGLVDEFNGRRPLQREPSYIGVHELGAFSGAALSLAFVAICLRRDSVLGIVGGIAGGLGVALAAALDSVGGVAAAGAAALAVGWRRARATIRSTLALAALVGLVAVAAVTLRASSVSAFLQFLGVRTETSQSTAHVETYAHRTLLAYLGLKIWLDHPVIGSGWQESFSPAAFGPHLAEAHRRFPDEAAAAFPSRENEWGVQNGILQTLADLGIVGLALLAAAVLAALRLAWRAVGRVAGEPTQAAAVSICWIFVAAAVFVGTGLLPGSSMESLLWLSVGFAASLAPETRTRRH
jgi:O-antigen ligase